MTTTRTPRLLVIFTSFTLFTPFAGAQNQRPPVFRSGVELLQIDVTVLDKNRKPVRGLTKDDFTLLEDGKPQTIDGFAEVIVPETVHAGPAWSRDVTPDVTGNQIDNKRIVVMVLDDVRGVGGSLGRKNLMQEGEEFVDSLGPQDLAAIVFTNQVKKSQGLTSDRNKLLTALHAYPLYASGPPVVMNALPGANQKQDSGLGCLAIKESLWTIRAIVDNLSTVPDRRKALVYFSGTMPWVMMPSDDPCGTYWIWRDILTAAQQGHVTINPVRPTGGIGANEDYLAVAENTGGRAVQLGSVDDISRGLQLVLVENGSYYLLAYPVKPGDADGTYRRLTVKVNRPDVEIVTRRGYWTPRVKAADDPKNSPPPPEIEAIAGILPSAKLNLRASVAVFAGAAGKGATLAITVGVTQPAFPSRTREVIDVLVKAYSADGDPKGTESSVIPIMVPPGRAGAPDSYYEVLSRVDVAKPGKYEVRLSAHSAETDERGSVYVDVDVPDFTKAKLSMSGVVLNSALTLVPVAPARLLADVAPAVPTAQRTFARIDRVSAFLKLCQGGDAKLVPITVKTRIRDAANKNVFDESDTFAPDRFGPDRSADLLFQLPLERLSLGEHLLTLEATLDKLVVHRDIVFTVK